MENNKGTQKSRSITTRAFDKSKGAVPSDSQEVRMPELTCYKLETMRQEQGLLEEILSTENMRAAWKQVKSNKGSPGIDGQSINECEQELKRSWPTIKQSIIDGSYKPQPLLKVEIPKTNGKMRKLCIPTVKDRLIQQAVAQKLSQYIDSSFADESYGYRPKRSPHQATLKARQHIEAGYSVTVDLDIETYFDSVDQDRLMSQLNGMIGDKRVLTIIRKILNSININGKGIPQGGPLSPILSNIYLDPLDKELKERGHRFVRYADDCKIFVATNRSAERVLGSIKKFLESKLKLKVHEGKSKISKICEFLGFAITQKSIRIMSKAIDRLKDKVREIVKIRGGKSIVSVMEQLSPILRGWCQYYSIQTSTSQFTKLNSWIRRRFRAMIYKSYKNGKTRYEAFKAGRMSQHVAYTCAYSNYGPWSMALSKPMRIIFCGKKLSDMGLYTLGSRR